VALPVVTVASGGLPVADVALDASLLNKLATPVSEAANGFGRAVTKVTAPALGLPVIYVTPPP
jgi:hypothetical protein